MAESSHCYLCNSDASVEEVRGQGGQRFDVQCCGECPQYEIALGAIDYLKKNKNHRKCAIDAIIQIAASGRFPTIKTVGIPIRLVCTSREDEQKEA